MQLRARSPLLSHCRSCIMSATLASHQHGKSRVRLGRVWREGNTHHMVEWTVFSMLESDMAHAFTGGSNADMTATDTQKNTARPNWLVFAAKWTNGTMDAILRCRCTMWPSSARNDALLRSTPSRLPDTSSRHTPRSVSLLGESFIRR